MSSHREAPEISKDPVADSTDLYAFVSPDAPDTVTLIANYVPLQGPAGGPNFYEFGDDVLYEIHIDNDGDGDVDISFQFSFSTVIQVGGTFLYNVGPISSLDSSAWNRRQFYSVTRSTGRRHGHGPSRASSRSRPRTGSTARRVLATDLPCPPCNVGPRSTPNYSGLADAAIQSLPGRRQVCSRASARKASTSISARSSISAPCGRSSRCTCIPIPGSAAAVNATKEVNVHSIALQLPKRSSPATAQRRPTRREHVVGHRRLDHRVPPAGALPLRARPRQQPRERRSVDAGLAAWATRCSTRCSSRWSARTTGTTTRRTNDSEYADGVLHPELAKLLPVLYPGVFPNLAALNASGKPRADLAAILLTGIPPAIVARLPELHGHDAGRPAAVEHGDPARRARRAISASSAATSPASRTAGASPTTSSRSSCKAIAGATYPLDRPDVHARRRGRRRRPGPDHERDRPDREGHRELPGCLPVPRAPAQRLRRSRG